MSASFPFYPTSAVSCREVLKLIALAQEAVMKEGPWEVSKTARSPCPLSGPFHVQAIQPGRPSGQGSSEAALGQGRLRKTHSSLLL